MAYISAGSSEGSRPSSKASKAAKLEVISCVSVRTIGVIATSMAPAAFVSMSLIISEAVVAAKIRTGFVYGGECVCR